jgi:hypothetical protein
METPDGQFVSLYHEAGDLVAQATVTGRAA